MYVTNSKGKDTVKCTLVQALGLCTGRTAHRGSRGIALLFHDHGTRRGWGVSVTPRPLFTPGKTRYPLYRRLGGPQGRSGQARKISPPPEFDPRTVQPVASSYTDYATRSNKQQITCLKNLYRPKLLDHFVTTWTIWNSFLVESGTQLMKFHWRLFSIARHKTYVIQSPNAFLQFRKTIFIQRYS